MADKGRGRLHPDMQAMLDRRAALGLPGFAAGSPDDARRTFAQSQAALPPDRGARIALVEDIAIPASHGTIAARRYIARPGAVGGRILYFHGGGWVFGTLDGFDAVCRDLAQATGAEIISVDYRLAPEHRFPAAIDDGWTALLAYSDARPLAVMGDSAGIAPAGLSSYEGEFALIARKSDEETGSSERSRNLNSVVSVGCTSCRSLSATENGLEHFGAAAQPVEFVRPELHHLDPLVPIFPARIPSIALCPRKNGKHERSWKPTLAPAPRMI